VKIIKIIILRCNHCNITYLLTYSITFIYLYNTGKFGETVEFFTRMRIIGAILLIALFVGGPFVDMAGAITGNVSNSSGHSLGQADLEAYRFFNVDTPSSVPIYQSSSLQRTDRNLSTPNAQYVRPNGVEASTVRNSNAKSGQWALPHLTAPMHRHCIPLHLRDRHPSHRKILMPLPVPGRPGPSRPQVRVVRAWSNLFNPQEHLM
jgi:hypothetical protein